MAVLAVGLLVLRALRIRRHCDLEAEANRAASGGDRTASFRAVHPSGDGEQAEREENPTEIQHLMIVPLAGLDLPSLRALAYAASLRQPTLALHISPTEHEA